MGKFIFRLIGITIAFFITYVFIYVISLFLELLNGENGIPYIWQLLITLIIFLSLLSLVPRDMLGEDTKDFTIGLLIFSIIAVLIMYATGWFTFNTNKTYTKFFNIYSIENGKVFYKDKGIEVEVDTNKTVNKQCKVVRKETIRTYYPLFRDLVDSKVYIECKKEDKE